MSDVAILPADERASALMTAPAMGAGVTALAAMSDREFQSRMQALMQGQERLQVLHRTLMRPDVDFGTIPGTPKPTLFKPGAERLCQFYRLAPEFVANVTYGNAVSEPAVTVVCFCRLHVGDLDGPVVGMADGACSSWERKYRYRRGERVCPRCGVAGALNKSKRDPEFYCWNKKGGCGATFPDNDPEITQQAVGDIENPDQYDLLNTVLKMAEKRAFVAAVLLVTATSSLYTQDVAEEPAAPAWEPALRQEAAPAQQRAAPAPQQQRAPESSGDRAANSVAAVVTGAASGRCAECNAPDGKHATKCSLKGGGAAPAPGADDAALRRLTDEARKEWQALCRAEVWEPSDIDLRLQVWGEILRKKIGSDYAPSVEDMENIVAGMKRAGEQGAEDALQPVDDPFDEEPPAGALFAAPAAAVNAVIAGHAR